VFFGLDAFDEEEAEVLDPVFEAFELDLALPGVEGGGDLLGLDALGREHRDLDFLGEGHAVVEGLKRRDFFQGGGPEDPHAGLGVADVGEEEDVQGEVEGEVAEAVLQRHGPVFEVGEAVRGDEVEAFVKERGDVVLESVEGVGGVGISGDDDVAGGVDDAGLVRASVASAGFDDDAGALGGRDLAGAVLGVAVDDKDLEVPVVGLEGLGLDGIDGLADAGFLV